MNAFWGKLLLHVFFVCLPLDDSFLDMLIESIALEIEPGQVYTQTPTADLHLTQVMDFVCLDNITIVPQIFLHFKTNQIQVLFDRI
jgi:hypothetical protein